LATLQPVRGTHDLLPAEERRHRAVAETARAVAGRYGFEAMATPVFEFTDVFARSIGETSDIVSKEMYTFEDRGGERVTLRPENTAGVARAVVSNGLAQSLPLRFFYYGPMFRHERPQKGRQRQFHQIGCELIGAASALADVEVIACGADILASLGLLDRTRLDLNTIGDTESRAAYRAALVEYFSGHKDKLSADSLTRLERNPLRILDSKDEGDRALVATAPLFAGYLNDASKQFFQTVTDGLDALGIAYRIEPRLVRGLDYYSHTTFEFVTTELGSQGTVLAGGRYDGLIAEMGGPPTPGIGWAAGVERLSMMIEEPPAPPRAVAIVPLGEAGETIALKLAHDLRRAGFTVDLSYSGNMKKRMARANKINARAAIILGDDEIAAGEAGLRDLDSGEQSNVPLDEIGRALSALLA
jgi:histidyl-tRNA synthetase